MPLSPALSDKRAPALLEKSEPDDVRLSWLSGGPTPVGVHTNRDGMIVYSNMVHAGMVRHKPEDVVGRHISVISADASASVIGDIRRCVSGEIAATGRVPGAAVWIAR